MSSLFYIQDSYSLMTCFKCDVYFAYLIADMWGLCLGKDSSNCVIVLC